MGYYDNVKDSIRDENSEKDTGEEEASGSGSGSGPGAGNFDTLREAAEETKVEEDEESGDDTPIEILEEDGLRQEAPSNQRTEASTQRQKKTQKRSQQRAKEKQRRQGNSNAGLNKSENVSQASEAQNDSRTVSGDTSDLEDKLDKIIEQNARMIEILEGFGN